MIELQQSGVEFDRVFLSDKDIHKMLTLARYFISVLVFQTLISTNFASLK